MLGLWRDIRRAALENLQNIEYLLKWLEEREHVADFKPDVYDRLRAALIALKGLGPWSAKIYLLMALCRPDAWPSGDLALATAVREVKGLAARPTPEELAAMSEAWRPWRAVAARLFWHYYLSQPPSARRS